MRKALFLVAVAACSGSPTGSTPDAGPDGSTDGGIDGPVTPVNPLLGIGTVTPITVPAGNKFLEGPQWRASSSDWLLTNIPGNTIYRYVPGGAVTTFLTPSGNANGLAQESGGTVLAAEHGGRRIARITGTTVTAVAERFEGKLLNSPNDVISASDGTIYFTDPPYGLGNRPAELDFNGVFRVSPAGTVTAEFRSPLTNRPNGIALSPDGKTLYVAFTIDGAVQKFAIMANGALGPPTLAAQTAGGADGMAVDAAGNLFVTSNNGIEVFAPDGTKWGEIAVPPKPTTSKPTNCAFGGTDRRTLLITTPQALYEVRLANPGLPTK